MPHKVIFDKEVIKILAILLLVTSVLEKDKHLSLLTDASLISIHPMIRNIIIIIMNVKALIIFAHIPFGITKEAFDVFLILINLVVGN